MTDPFDPGSPDRPPHQPGRPDAPRPDAAQQGGAPGGAQPGSAPRADYAAGSEGPNPEEAQLRGDYRSRGEQFRETAEEAAARVRGAAEKAQEHTRVHMESARATISESDDRAIAIAGYALALAAGVTILLSPVIGVVLVWVKKDTPSPVIASHIRFQLRTFWIGLAALIGGLVLTKIFIGWLALLALGLWWIFRHTVGLVRLLEGRPVRDPAAWLI